MKNKKEIESLKKDLDLKKEIFELIRESKKESKTPGHNQRANELDEKLKVALIKNPELQSYFGKFIHEDHNGRKARLLINGFQNQYSEQCHLNQVLEDLQRLEREIEEKENRLAQNIFLKQQKEFIELQKKDIEENKKDRKKLNNFTLALASGVLATIIFYISQILIQFKAAPTMHIMLLLGICIFGLILIFLFVISVFDIGEELIKFWKDRKGLIIFLTISIIILCILLLCIPDNPTTINNEELNLINQEINEIKNINLFLNQSVNNQKEMNDKLEIIFLNQIQDNNS